MNKLKSFSLCFLIFLLFISCDLSEDKGGKEISKNPEASQSYLSILGTLQDGGSPHAGCKKDCCKDLFQNPKPERMVVCIGIVDAQNKKYWMLEASPDFSRQVKLLQTTVGFEHAETPDGIFITHAHIGHYAGLMYLGREAMNAKSVEVFAMPRLKNFIETNGPWCQLVNLNNIHINQLEADSEIKLSSNFKIVPFLVPHRDEFSETVGYKIIGPNKSALFIPDIDKWEKWGRSIVDEIKKVDCALIDGTFYDAMEINNRNIKEIPHPFVIETMRLYEALPILERSKIHFIHFNHTNHLLNCSSIEAKDLMTRGFGVCNLGMKFSM